MGKSYAQLADEILKGALTDPAKNPMNPSTGHQASMPAVDPNDRLIEMSDTQRSMLMERAGAFAKEEQDDSTPSGWGAPTTTLELTPQELETLSEAKRIIEKIQEATTVGNIGINFAGNGKGADAKAITLPGDVNVAASPKKRAKKKAKTKTNDFLHYINK